MGFVAGSQDTIVPDPDKSWRKHMQSKPADKFLNAERHTFFAGFLAIIFEGKGYLPIIHGQ